MTEVLIDDLPDLPSDLLRLAMTYLSERAAGPTSLRDAVAEHLPRQWSRDTRCKLSALEAFQRGHVRQAFFFLNLPWLSVDDWFHVTPYRYSLQLFLQDLERIAQALEIRGY